MCGALILIGIAYVEPLDPPNGSRFVGPERGGGIVVHINATISSRWNLAQCR